MNCVYTPSDKLLTIEITEEIDHHTVEKIRRRVDYEIQRYMPRKVIFNFNSVTFMDSAGIGMIIGRYKMASAFGGNIEMINVKPNIKRILEISGVSKLIEIKESLFNEKLIWKWNETGVFK